MAASGCPRGGPASCRSLSRARMLRREVLHLAPRCPRSGRVKLQGLPVGGEPHVDGDIGVSPRRFRLRTACSRPCRRHEPTTEGPPVTDCAALSRRFASGRWAERGSPGQLGKPCEAGVWQFRARFGRSEVLRVAAQAVELGAGWAIGYSVCNPSTRCADRDFGRGQRPRCEPRMCRARVRCRKGPRRGSARCHGEHAGWARGRGNTVAAPRVDLTYRVSVGCLAPSGQRERSLRGPVALHLVAGTFVGVGSWQHSPRFGKGLESRLP